jgi:cellulose biosynthesis protein BcsQ
MKSFWVTFYSYKGGVGRSMALVNLATLLARKGRRVFMIDFDLEAPGLDSFQDLGVESKQPGVVEYAHEFQQTKIAPDLAPFVQECKFKSRVRGKVWLMPSGRKDEAYNSKRVKLNWENLYDEGLGTLFVENWKAAICHKYKPDFVFVDSRTGLTDIGGICTLHLPDLVVLLFGLNDQNLHGISAVLQTIRTAKALKPPQIVPVATPMPNLPKSEGNLYKQRLDKAEQLLAVPITCTISYSPEAALVERLFTLEDEQQAVRIAAEYQSLLNEIQTRNQNGLDALIAQALERCKGEDEVGANRIKKFLLDDFDDRADALYHIGQIERRFVSREAAAESWKRAVEIEPDHIEAFAAVAMYYKQKEKCDDLIRLHDIRIKYARNNNLQSLNTFLTNKGEDLMGLSRYVEAAACYRETLNHLSKDPQTRLICIFNAAESSRRASHVVADAPWKMVIQIFESLAYENTPVNAQANQFQAMHVAYACVGELEKAKQILMKAANCGLATGKALTIFSLKSYTYVSVDIFLEENKEMLSALQRGHLWDGMEMTSDAGE